MRKIFTFVISMMASVSMMAQGWPSNYQGVMLQGFYWDSFADTQWSNLESQADELAEFFKLVWIPQSGKSASEPSMGYNDLYWFNDYTSSFGTEQQLRSMINTFKQKGIGTIADVVINHRSSLAGTWMSFPEETYKGVTYTMGAADICANDDGGKAAANAEVKPTGANDSGTDFDGARDLDHSSTNVQSMVKAYLDFLLNDLGYTGFRYDMVKGYAPSYTGIYNTAAKPEFSVGEYWDGVQQTKNWIDGTKVDGVVQSAAFDFPLKYLLNNCCNTGSNWNTLGGSSLISDMNYRRYAVTFVDNHDTNNRGNNNDLTANIMAANAFILAAPGTPCVFLTHWMAYKNDLKQLIYARNTAGISNESQFATLARSASQYAIQVNGADGKSVVILMGATTWPRSTADEADYFLVQTGDNYAYYLSRNAETAWASAPSGTYDGAFSLTLNAVSAEAGAQIVYTTDGSDPSATNGTTVADGATVTVDKTMTLKAAVIAGGAVKGMITRNYKITDFQPHDITVYVNADNVGWANMNYHTWGGDNTHGTDWPGTRVTNTTVIDGKTWYYNTYHISSSTDYVSFVFSTNSGSPQTVDVVNVKEDKFFEISTSQSSGKYLVNDVTDDHTSGIGNVTIDTQKQPANADVYTIDGRLVRRNAMTTDAAEAVSALKALGVRRTVMLSGDSARICTDVGTRLGIDEVRYELLPSDKTAELERIMADRPAGRTVAYVGDGINDAPSLARADVGIAMGGLGSDAAIEAADIVIMDDAPSKIPVCVSLSKRVNRIVLENIVFALAVKFAILALTLFGYTDMWAAVFGDVGVTVIAVLNVMRCMDASRLSQPATSMKPADASC